MYCFDFTLTCSYRPKQANVGSILLSTLTVFFLVGIDDSEAPVDIDIDGSFALVLVSPVKAPLSKLSTRQYARLRETHSTSIFKEAYFYHSIYNLRIRSYRTRQFWMPISYRVTSCLNVRFAAIMFWMTDGKAKTNIDLVKAPGGSG